MGSPRPPNWSFAARAAYFGDQLCPFCEHRNPAGAKFCNECASPLHLKPCKRCDSVNHASATACYKCGAVYPALLNPEPAAWPAFEAEPAAAAVAATLPDPKAARTPSRSGWPSIKAGQLVLAAIVTVLIASAYSVYRTAAAPPVENSVVSQGGTTGEYAVSTATLAAPIAAQSQLADVREHDASNAAPAPSVAVESKPFRSDRAVIADPANVAGGLEAANRAATATLPLPAPKPASAHQRSAGERAVAKSPSGANKVAAARVGAHPAESRNALQAAPGELMNVSLARCNGDLIARIVCEQRVRQRFCEGRWGEAPECPMGVANEHRR